MGANFDASKLGTARRRTPMRLFESPPDCSGREEWMVSCSKIPVSRRSQLFAVIEFC